jgi:hypothetical protein
MAFFRWLVFEFRNFRQAARMPLSVAESCGEKWFDQFPGERMADHEATEEDHVQIVVLDALVCREVLVDHGRWYVHIAKIIRVTVWTLWGVSRRFPRGLKATSRCRSSFQSRKVKDLRLENSVTGGTV